ncbi:MAG: glycoside hydrolase family 3 N-terminal domain-containing protein [Planctomycetota bacterium]
MSDLLARMTLEEKVGQLVQFSSGGATGPDNVEVNERELAAQGFIGSILNTSGADDINPIQRCAVEDSRLGIPILFALDVIHGYRTIFPVPLGLSATWDLELIERCARMSAVEAASEGIRWNFSPMVDVSHDARWGRIMESGGEDTLLNEAVAAAFVRGYQGDDLSEPTSMLACAKHLAGYGAPIGGRDYDSVELSERTLRDTYLPPFKAALDAGCATMMSGFHTVAGVPSTANRHILRDILRDEWGFQGIVVSDWNSIGELVTHGVAIDGRTAALKAFSAGVDVDMQANLYVTQLADLVRAGEIAEDVLNDAVRRMLRLKCALGLFERPYVDAGASSSTILTPAHRAVARQAAERSFVLLQNQALASGRPALPIDTATTTVALIGPYARSHHGLLGGWVMRGRDEDTAPIAPALGERLGENLLIADGCGFERDERDAASIQEAVEVARRADVAVLVLGERWDMSGEARSRTRLDLPGGQQELLKAVAATRTPVVLVVFTGRPLVLTREAEDASSMLLAWFPGTEAGPALARVLCGEVSPSGRLTASFPRHVGQMPMPYSMLSTGRPVDSDTGAHAMVVGYRDEARASLFPFGFGLSYTAFEYSTTAVSADALSARDLDDGAMLGVSATITNTGSRPGTETAQLYVEHRGGSVARPTRLLKGFRRVHLDTGEECRVEFTLSAADLRYTGEGVREVCEPGVLSAVIAPHAADGTPVSVQITT